MNWYTNATFYELYVRAFADSNSDGHGDFGGLRTKLDYLQWLGVDCIWLLPMYPSPLKDDGYDIADYHSIHPDYGTLNDFKGVVEEIHARGMKVIVDLVLNHTSDQHPWFQESRRSKDSPLRDYYVWSTTPDKYSRAGIVFPHTETSNWEYDAQTGEYYWHRFYKSQPDLNYANPKVQEAMLDVAGYWLAMGIDGFRADAVPFLFEREGTDCEGLPETHAYVKRVRQLIDSKFPNAILLAEACMQPADLLPYFGNNDEFHLAFNFPVMPRMYLALAQQDRSSIVQVIESTPPLPTGCQWATFLRNHDELNLWLVNDEERALMRRVYAPSKDDWIEIGVGGIRRRLAPMFDNDQRKIELINSLLFTLPGTPVLYYGDEIGMGDDVTLYDRNGVRTPMQWTSDSNGGFSAAKPYAPVVNPAAANVAAQQADPHSLLHAVRRMIAARKRLPVLADGSIQWLDSLPKHLLCFWRLLPKDAASGKNTAGSVLALHNLSDQPYSIPARAGLVDVLNPETAVGEAIELPPYGYRWFTVQS
ncbi:MAG: maltose alpha-D-glucosyltransferase [Anaerolineae bacterium]